MTGQPPEQMVVQRGKSQPSLDGTSHCCAFGESLVGVVACEFLGDDPEEEARGDLAHQDPEDPPDHLGLETHEPV